MSRAEAIRAIEVGIEVANAEMDKGVKVLGIGNTTLYFRRNKFIPSKNSVRLHLRFDV